jgi:protein gp37
MAENTAISWTDHTFNPWIGCTKVSPGCANCYAATQDNLRKWTPDGWGKGKPRKRTSAGNWKDPLKWNHRASPEGRGVHYATHGAYLPEHRPRVFCASLADWLDDEVPIEWLRDLLYLIYRTENLDWLLLTKRPENFFRRMKAVGLLNGKEGSPDENAYFAEMIYCWIIGSHFPPNVWIGATVEDQQRANERIPLLLGIPAKVRFLSCEPLLGPLGPPNTTTDSQGIDWLICGGESGPGFRKFDPEWARSLRDQCKAAGVAFHMKQMGGLRPSTMPPIPRDLLIREYPQP